MIGTAARTSRCMIAKKVAKRTRFRIVHLPSRPQEEDAGGAELGARSSEAPAAALMRLYLVTIPVIILPGSTRSRRNA